MCEELANLKIYLKELGSIAVGYSSGVDSTFLLKVAKEVLGDNVLAITARSEFFPQNELQDAIEFCRKENIKHIIYDFKALEVDGIKENPANRCYLCKKTLFMNMQKLAADNGIKYVVEGSNLDDLGDYRPGLKAIEELHIKSPLRDCKFTKEMIRILSKDYGLNTWDKPSFACLASRFVYGEEITREKLNMVEKAENLLKSKGFTQFRVRIHDNLARVEVLPDEIDKFMEKCTRDEITSKFKEYGFKFVTLDLAGYRMGSMNEVLSSVTGGQ